MPEAAVYGLLIVFPVVGVIARRWVVIVLPLVAWPVFYLGLNRGWWFHGTGDGWQSAAGFFTVFGLASTAFAVWIARTLEPRTGRQRRRPVSPSG